MVEAKEIKVEDIIDKRTSSSSRIAAERAKEIMEEHRNVLERRGIGTHYGTESSYAELTKKQKNRRFTRAALRKGVEPSGYMPEKTNCMLFTADVITEYINASVPLNAGPGVRVDVVNVFLKHLEDSAGRGRLNVPVGRGTAAANYLQENYGFIGMLYSTNPNFSEFKKASDLKKIARNKKGKDLFVRGKTSGEQVKVSTNVDQILHTTEGLEILKNIPFGFGVTFHINGEKGWGVHTFILASGKVYESHWTYEPTEPNLFEETTLKKFVYNWPLIFIVAPPINNTKQEKEGHNTQQ